MTAGHPREVVADGLAPLVARVLPDVSGLDKRFDYLVPDDLRDQVRVGTRVRVSLHGRRVGAWVTDLAPPGIGGAASAGTPRDLKPIAKVTGHGPAAEMIELAEWAAWRWAARRVGSLLVSASPDHAVPRLPPAERTGRRPAPSSPAASGLFDAGGGVLRLPPRSDLLPALLSAAGVGPTLAVVPGHAAALLLANRLRRAGLSVATMPTDWARAAAGVDVVIGTRVAAWAPCPDVAGMLLLDEHEEALQEERSPTWHARDVLAERARRAGVPLVMVSPAPSLVAIEQHAGPGGPVHPPTARERAAWPVTTVVDRRDEDPWRRSLLTSPLIERLRDTDCRVVCVANITGRARVLACRSCRALIRCESCDAAVAMGDDGRLGCRRCGVSRPAVCQVCGASRFANLRPGVTRLREEFEAAAARPVVSVTGADEDEPPADAGVYVGTEAVLHRVGSADVVVFLEFDSELLAPRYRAAEEALALLIRAGRIAPHVMVQTFVPDHVVIRAAVAGDPGLVVAEESERRRMFGFPPYGALAALAGPSLDDFLAHLREHDVTVGRDADRALVRAADWRALADALATPPRPDGNHLRIHVDPPRP